MTIFEVLKNISRYPVSSATLRSVAMMRGINVDVEATIVALQSKEYELAVADIKRWVSEAPNISQAGISFSIDEKTRDSLKKQANTVYKTHKDPAFSGIAYGYKGSNL